MKVFQTKILQDLPSVRYISTSGSVINHNLKKILQIKLNIKNNPKHSQWNRNAENGRNKVIWLVKIRLIQRNSSHEKIISITLIKRDSQQKFFMTE